MKLIIGGAYQGKREFAVRELGVAEESIFTCTPDALPDFTAPCLDRFEEFVRYCLDCGLDARQILADRKEEWKDAVILFREVFSGVVPVDEKTRAWREEAGRTAAALAAQAETVIRMFCGIPQVLR